MTLETDAMQKALFALPFILIQMSCSGCSDDSSGNADVSAVPQLTDAGSPTPDTGQPPIVDPNNEILGTWAFDASEESPGGDGIGFFQDGVVAVYSTVADCGVANIGTFTLEGDQLTVVMGSQAGESQTIAFSGDQLTISGEGMPTLVLTRRAPPCGQPEEVRDLTQMLTATWRVEGAGERGHILAQRGQYIASPNVAECAVAESGNWAVEGNSIHLRLGEVEMTYQLAVQDDGNLELRSQDGSVERWIRGTENCEERPNEYNIVGTWTTDDSERPVMAFGLDREVKFISDLSDCTVTGTRRYVLSAVPSALIIIPESQEEEAEEYRFIPVDEENFKIIRNGVETLVTRNGASCHGSDGEAGLEYPIIGTWEGQGDGAPHLAFSEQGRGIIVDSVDTCGMQEVIGYRLIDNPPTLEVLHGAGDHPHPGEPHEPESYAFEARSQSAFNLTKDGVVWRYVKSRADCHNEGAINDGEQLDYPIAGTWEASGDNPALSLSSDDQGNFGSFLTSLAGCVSGEGFTFSLSGDPASFEMLLNRGGRMERLAFDFLRISESSFSLRNEQGVITYTRSRTNCHQAGEAPELDYGIVGTWGSNAEGAPSFAFQTDNLGNLGHELSSLENCVIAASFSFRLVAVPPTLERLYTNEQGQLDERRGAFRVIDANSFGLTTNGVEAVYTRLGSTCHEQGNVEPPPADVDAQQLVGTWAAAQGTSGYALNAQNHYKILSNTVGCVEESHGNYELVGNLLTFTGDHGERPLFFVVAMPDVDTLSLTDDNQQVQLLRRIRTNCHGN
jgi:hypothetical protein